MALSAAKVDIYNRAADRIGETQGLQDATDQEVVAKVCERHYDDILTELLETRRWKWATRQIPIAEIQSQSQTTAGDAANLIFNIPYAMRDSSQLTVELIDNASVATELTAVTDYTLTPAVIGSTPYITLTGSAPAADESIRITVTISRVGWDYVYACPADMVTPIGLLHDDQRHNTVPRLSRLEFDVMPNELGDAMILLCDVAAADFAGLEYVARIEHVPLFPRLFVEALIWRLSVELAYAIPKNPKLASDNMVKYNAALEKAAAKDYNLGHNGSEPATPSILARG